eukprot:TRINITY_DN9593_c0_g1_i1.p1 TRINITY_DN9593_c0_g1~~TRINITY_DN9593_c0_g1_i1.p1  ORF type:complete len:302 (+),score=60.78 TRINITY_DN9593_c0_g1_i1:57-962(+)
MEQQELKEIVDNSSTESQSEKSTSLSSSKSSESNSSTPITEHPPTEPTISETSSNSTISSDSQSTEKNNLSSSSNNRLSQSTDHNKSHKSKITTPPLSSSLPTSHSSSTSNSTSNSSTTLNNSNPEIKSNVKKESVVFPPEAVGKALFKKVVDDNTMKLLSVLRTIITKHRDADTGREYNNYIIKTGTRVAFLYKQKYVTKENIVSLRFGFRRLCSSIANAFRFLDIQPIDHNLPRIAKIIHKFKVDVVNLISPFIADASVNKLIAIFDYIGSDEFLRFCFGDPELFKEIVYVLSYYLKVT